MKDFNNLNSVKKIFVVDDSAVSLNVAKDMLKELYKVFTAASAEEFFRMIEIVEPDLILMDVEMPNMSGYEAIKILKADKWHADIPVIFLTAISDSKSEVKGLGLGAVDYITKPFNKSILMARIKTHLTIMEQRQIIEQISLMDALTKIQNRRFFDERLEEEWARAIRDMQPIGMLMIDADKFKDFNDTYGHHQGDVALQTLAHIISTSARRGMDVVARWGGEEFAVILPNTDASGVSVVAENIRMNVEKSIIPRIDDTSQGLSVTVSIGGVSVVPALSDSVEDFVKKSDDALYEAKSMGRNRVCMFEN